jgi:hypothetical protein
MIRRFLVLLATTLALMGCSGMKIEDFAGKTPVLKIDEYFLGRTRAWGIFEDRFANLRREFTVDIEGKWEGDEFVLDEHFDYADGEKDRRVWRLKKTGENTWEGRTPDAIGVAIGKQVGNAFSFKYDINLKMNGRTLAVHFDDWMYLQPDGVLLNRAYVSKWGIDIGAVTLAFKRVP